MATIIVRCRRCNGADTRSLPHGVLFCRECETYSRGNIVHPATEEGMRAVLAGCTEESHSHMENAVPYISDGPLGHGWECGRCGAFLQAG